MAGFDRFNKTWASSGPVTLPTDQQADMGWDFIGGSPPTVQQFNALFRWLDEKDNWLFAQMREVLLAASITPSASPDTQLLSALATLFPPTDLSYLEQSLAQVITAAGQTPDGTPRLNAALAATYATIAQVNARINRSGDTMTGPLGLSGDPTNANHAARKSYVDAAVSPKVNRSGDTMTGPLNLSGYPTADAHATAKGYVDASVAARVSRAGDTMTGALGVQWPTADAHATPKAYVDGQRSLAQSGYAMLPGGLILQWGYGVSNAAGDYGLTFPIAFPSACFSIVGNHIGTDAATVLLLDGTLSRTGCVLRTRNHLNSASPAPWGLFWQATGA